MKTGIVFEIKNDQATIMKNNGAFVTIPAEKNWQKGDVVTIKNKQINLKPLYAIAACFLLFISLSAYGITTYYEEISIISLDVNPSIEIKLNRYNRVIGIDVLNDEGQEIIEGINIKNKKYDEAIELLFLNENFNIYIEDNSYIVFTISSKKLDMEEYLYISIQNIADMKISSKHHTAKIECYTVNEQILNHARHYSITAGKYITILQLQEEMPEVNIIDYIHHSITEIKTKIMECQNLHNNNTEQEQHNSNMTDNFMD